MRELASRIGASSKPKVLVNCVTPGACKSDFNREFTGLKRVMFNFMAMLIARSTEAGSRTLLAGASTGLESHGAYMADCVVAR